tara:strand:- start:1775 stop:2197 length:423 start_codon:yes stop_codon:yes gene_type:complete
MEMKLHTVVHRGIRCEIVISSDDCHKFWRFTVKYFDVDGNQLEDDAFGLQGHADLAIAQDLAEGHCRKVVDVNIDGHRREGWAKAVLLDLQAQSDQLWHEAQARRAGGDVDGAHRLESEALGLSEVIDAAKGAYNQALRG